VHRALGPLLLLATSGCAALKAIEPIGPVLSFEERARWDRPYAPSGVTYTGSPRHPAPVPPVQAFGVTYDLDLVIRSKHPDWDMHELARIVTPDGPLWLVKDARRATLAQTIVADLPDIDAWWPEVPVERRGGPVQVDDRSAGDEVDVRVRYTNVDGHPAEIAYRGRVPAEVGRKRNGPTMGHSAHAVMAVLSIPGRSLGKDASVVIDGREQRLVRILGLVPFRAALVQTQGGFSAGDLVQRTVDGAVETEHAAGAVQRWEVRRDGAVVELVQPGRLRALRYRFLPVPVGVDGGEALELVEIRVEQTGEDAPALFVRFDPALPDVRRTFAGTGTSRWVMDVAGSLGQATGTVAVTSTVDGAVVDVAGSAPAWVADRPVHGSVTFAGGDARSHWELPGPPPR
jgi:hypothetical protein